MQVELNKTYFYKENGNSVTTIGYLNDNKVQLSDGSIIKSDRFFNYFTDRVTEQAVNSYNNTFQTNINPTQYTQQAEQVPTYIINNQQQPIHQPPVYNPQPVNNYPTNNYTQQTEMVSENVKNNKNYNPDYGGVIKEQRFNNAGQQITFVEMQPTIESEVRDSNGNVVKLAKKSIPPVNVQQNNPTGNVMEGYDLSVMDEEERAAFMEYYNRPTNNTPQNIPINPTHVNNPIVNNPANTTQTYNKPVVNYNANITTQAKDLLGKMKKSHEANFSFNIKTKVPDLEYLKKSEEMLNIDLFDALSEELVEHYINNPQVLKRTIINELKNLNNKNLVKIKDTPKRTNKKKDNIETVAINLDEPIGEDVDVVAVDTIIITE